jgi:ATP-dependent helicase IRC3
LSDVFSEIVYELGMLPLIEAGYLADLRAIQIRLRADYGALHTRAGDFIEAETERAFLDANGPATVAVALRRHAPARKALVFTPSVVTAHATAAACDRAGIPAAAIDGGTPLGERRGALDRFRRGELRAVVNCAVLVEGYDEPAADCVVVARPTKSRALYQQMVGRGTRIYPGKADCLVLDLVGAADRHDLVTAASLFGLPASALDRGERTVAAAVAERQAAGALVVEVDGAIVSRPVELFKRRPVHWVDAGGGRFVLATGQGSVVLVPRDGAGDRWDVVQTAPGAPPALLAGDLPLGYAQGVAEDRARALGAGVLVDPAARWRSRPASDNQLAALRRMRVPVPPGLTRGAASDLIGARGARRGLAGRWP